MRGFLFAFLSLWILVASCAQATGFRLCGWAETTGAGRGAAPGGLPSAPGAVHLSFEPRDERVRAYAPRCGAALVTPGWALTARHCVEQGRWRVMEVQSGIRAGQAAVRSADVALCPAGTVEGSLQGDVALLRLSTPFAAEPVGVRFYRNDNPLAVPDRLWVASWRDGPDGPVLRELPLVPLAPTPLGHLVAQPKGGPVPCGGESGSPVYGPGANGPVLYGVLSGLISHKFADTQRPPCKRAGVRAVISPVSHWEAWVFDTIAACTRAPAACVIPE